MYVDPYDTRVKTIQYGSDKARMSARDLLIRSTLAGAFLAIATAVAYWATVQTKLPIAGAILFPAGFVLYVLIGLELVTGNFALLPVAGMSGLATMQQILRNFALVFLGNLIGSVIFAVLFWCSLTVMGTTSGGALSTFIVSIAEHKTIAYQALGGAGMVTVFVRAILCNWMVALGVYASLSAKSTTGKILATWLPIFLFFALGFEHTVVNMFVIPLGMMLGAKVSISTWWLWNQIPVTLGNFVGGFGATGLLLYITFQKKSAQLEEVAA
ncbi:MAG TPA: formate/nitrite transporter family protein [Candidatus Baltobacteraceae bacterium]|nr:formate/nitrite transporter family protein [Candidatus Baltobacteraceae bacterium]